LASDFCRQLFWKNIPLRLAARRDIPIHAALLANYHITHRNSFVSSATRFAAPGR